MGLKEEVLKYFPAPQFRKYQKEVIEKMAELFESDVKCIFLEAPTGFGKSYVNATFCAYWRSFYATPQLSLIDQMRNDYFLQGYFVEIKGREEYQCALDPTTSVKYGLCRKMPTVNCDRFKQCPYWVQKLKALEAKSVLMSFSYLILEGKTRTKYSFGARTLLVLDESHNIAESVVDKCTIKVTPYALPRNFYEQIRRYIPDEFKDIDDARDFIEYVLANAEEYMYDKQLDLEGKVVMTDRQLVEKDLLEEFQWVASKFVEDKSNMWVADIRWITGRDGKKYKCVFVQPLLAKDFMCDLVWWRAKYYIVSSATILDPTTFADEIGLTEFLKPDEIKHIKVPSTFPPENRPIINASVGKFTKENWDALLPAVARKIVEILEREKGNVAIHCHSYELQQKLLQVLRPLVGDRLIWHDEENREEKLKEWLNSKGKVFLCVGFEEGQDWYGEKCEAQILVKVPYPDIKDKRVAKRLEMKHWKWFKMVALRKLIQAYGRAVRSENDKARFYIIDGSVENLLTYMWKFVPKWFADALPFEWNRDKVKLYEEVKKIARKKYLTFKDIETLKKAREVFGLDVSKQDVVL